MMVAAVMTVASLVLSSCAEPGNPLIGTWQFDHLKPQSSSVDESGLRRVRAAVAPMQTIKVHFRADKLVIEKPGGDKTSYPVDYTIDRTEDTVTMTENRDEQTVKQVYNLMPGKPNQIYTEREFGPVGRVHMIYKHLDDSD